MMKKKYEKPLIEEHKAAAIVSGSDDCSAYKREVVNGLYYH